MRSFWAEKLGVPADQIAAAIGDYAKFSNLVRGKLMKKGGVGYVEPSPEAFPTVEEFHSFIVACGALPCAAWLDGITAGEQAIDELLALLIGKGVVALNIVPDRNWNIADPGDAGLKVAKLHEIVRIAGRLDLPLNVGTEMNAPGNKLVDDFDVPEMAPVRQAFLDGAALHLRPHRHAAGAGSGVSERVGEGQPADAPRAQHVLHGRWLSGAAGRRRSGSPGCAAGRHGAAGPAGSAVTYPPGPSDRQN